jgi:hypothetical protein
MVRELLRTAASSGCPAVKSYHALTCSAQLHCLEVYPRCMSLKTVPATRLLTHFSSVNRPLSLHLLLEALRILTSQWLQSQAATCQAFAAL